MKAALFFALFLLSFAQGIYAEANPAKATTVKAGRAVPADPFARGMELVHEQKYDAAAEEFERATRADPLFLNAQVEWARALTLAGKRREGIKRLDFAIRLARRKQDKDRLLEQRRLISSLFYRAQTFQKYQDGLNFLSGMKLRAAIEALEQALAIEPDNVDVLIAYARALQAVDDWKESVNVLEQAHLFDLDREEIRVLLGNALLHSNHERSLALLTPVIRRNSENEEAALIYAQALAKKGEIKSALETLEKAMNNSHDRPKVLFWLGKISAESPENRWVARRHLQAFLKRAEREGSSEELKPLAIEAQRLLGRLETELGIQEGQNGG